MTKSKVKKGYYFCIILILCTLLLFIYAYINTQVSLVYEVPAGTECMSAVSGKDLCRTLNRTKAGIGCSVFLLTLLCSLYHFPLTKNWLDANDC